MNKQRDYQLKSIPSEFLSSKERSSLILRYTKSQQVLSVLTLPARTNGDLYAEGFTSLDLLNFEIFFDKVFRGKEVIDYDSYSLASDEILERWTRKEATPKFHFKALDFAIKHLVSSGYKVEYRFYDFTGNEWIQRNGGNFVKNPKEDTSVSKSLSGDF
jgi:hypothetical protein